MEFTWEKILKSTPEARRHGEQQGLQPNVSLP